MGQVVRRLRRRLDRRRKGRTGYGRDRVDSLVATAWSEETRALRARAVHHGRRCLGDHPGGAAILLLSPDGSHHGSFALSVCAECVRRTRACQHPRTQRLLRSACSRSARVVHDGQRFRDTRCSFDGDVAGSAPRAAQQRRHPRSRRSSDSSRSFLADSAARTIDGVLDLSQRVLRDRTCICMFDPKPDAR